MKIRLQNIKCYLDETFDFGETGLALLLGQSGKGKSSIIQGIHFALFGVGSKITSFGKTTCKVELEFDGMKIVRSKNPGKLVVNDVFEDDAAQEMIDEKFGSTFEVTGYIPQNAIKSFVLMNPQDKLSFLEKFAFTNVDLAEIKQRCKQQTSALHDELLECTSKLEMITNMVDEIEEPEMVEFPLNVKNEDYESAIKTEMIRAKTVEATTKQTISSLDTLNEELNSVRLMKSKLSTNTQRIADLSVEIADTNTSLTSLDEYVGDDELNEYEKQLAYIVSNRTLTSSREQMLIDKATLEEMIERETHQLKTELEHISADLWLLHSKEESNETKESNEELLKDAERLESIQAKLKKFQKYSSQSVSDLEKLIKQSKCNVLLTCPSCKANVNFVDGRLEVNENDICESSTALSEKEVNVVSQVIQFKTELSDIESSYEDEIPDTLQIKEDLEYIREYEFTQTRNERRKNELERMISKKQLSSTCSAFAAKVNTAELQILKLEAETGSIDDVTLNEPELRELIDVQKSVKRLKKEYEKRIRDLRANVVKCDTENKSLVDSHFKDYSVDRSVDSVLEEIAKMKSLLVELEAKRKQHVLNLKKVDEWKRAKEEMKKFLAWEEKRDVLVKEEVVKRNEYGALMTLRENILEAESMVVMNIVESINTHARVYLDSFFEDDPITVRLQAFKQTKKNNNKAQINMEIEYKGMECELQMLSGGEMSRIVLAYTLALAEMFNTPLLLLDECTSSLDQETTTHVFDAIKEHFNGKLTIIVAHQVITGVFDKTINLDK